MSQICQHADMDVKIHTALDPEETAFPAVPPQRVMTEI